MVEEARLDGAGQGGGALDEEEAWLARATEAELERHAQRVKEIFEAYDISPLSTPSTSGRSSPTFQPPASTDAAGVGGSDQAAHNGGAGAGGEGESVPSGGASAEVQLEQRQEQEDYFHRPDVPPLVGVSEKPRHRRNSSLIDQIILSKVSEFDDGGGVSASKAATAAGAAVEASMKSTIFAKKLAKHVAAGKAMAAAIGQGELPSPPGANDLPSPPGEPEPASAKKNARKNSGADFELGGLTAGAAEEGVGGLEAGEGEGEGGRAADEAASQPNSDLISPFLDSLYGAEHAELAWMKPQSGPEERGRGAMEGAAGEAAAGGGAAGEDRDAALSMDGMLISSSSWIGSMQVGIPPEDGSPCALASRPDAGRGAPCVLTVGTSTGMVLVKHVRDLAAPQAAHTTRCEPPHLQANEKSLKITALATSFGVDNYVVCGYVPLSTLPHSLSVPIPLSSYLFRSENLEGPGGMRKKRPNDGNNTRGTSEN